jgi:PKD repeat protein
VTAAVQNVGDVDDTQTVTLDIEGLGSDSAEVSLPFGESTEETFTVSTSEGDAGEYTATVESEDDSASQVVAVTGSAEFEIASADMDEALVEGETLSMTVEVTNVGDGPGTQLLQAHADGLGSDSAAISLGVGESTQATLALDTEIGDVGEHVVTVETEDHGIEVPVEVHLPEMPDSEDPPEDVDGDNYYENVNGDDAFDIFDVQMFFEHYDDEMMDDHGWAFNFNEAGGINIFDVQSLFNDL